MWLMRSVRRESDAWMERSGLGMELGIPSSIDGDGPGLAERASSID